MFLMAKQNEITRFDARIAKDGLFPGIPLRNSVGQHPRQLIGEIPLKRTAPNEPSNEITSISGTFMPTFRPYGMTVHFFHSVEKSRKSFP